ncbi:hypothetical protein B0H11DRAFT_1931753 [Mycena galericulata]|nr:hypothetical protein B0H11DRAFT_1931753 [Mycena galericulata]
MRGVWQQLGVISPTAVSGNHRPSNERGALAFHKMSAWILVFALRSSLDIWYTASLFFAEGSARKVFQGPTHKKDRCSKSMPSIGIEPTPRPQVPDCTVDKYLNKGLVLRILGWFLHYEIRAGRAGLLSMINDNEYGSRRDPRPHR